MLKICLVFWRSEPQYAYKHYANKKHVFMKCISKMIEISLIDILSVNFPPQLLSYTSITCVSL